MAFIASVSQGPYPNILPPSSIIITKTKETNQIITAIKTRREAICYWDRIDTQGRGVLCLAQYEEQDY